MDSLFVDWKKYYKTLIAAMEARTKAKLKQ